MVSSTSVATSLSSCHCAADGNANAADVSVLASLMTCRMPSRSLCVPDVIDQGWTLQTSLSQKNRYRVEIYWRTHAGGGGVPCSVQICCTGMCGPIDARNCKPFFTMEKDKRCTFDSLECCLFIIVVQAHGRWWVQACVVCASHMHARHTNNHDRKFSVHQKHESRH